MADDRLTINVHIQPNASASEYAGIYNGRYKIRLNAPPVDGKANKALIEFIAKAFSVSKSKVSVLQGHTSRSKKIEIREPLQLPEWLNDVASPG